MLDPEIEMGSVELGWGKVFNDVGAVLAEGVWGLVRGELVLRWDNDRSGVCQLEQESSVCLSAGTSPA